MQIGLRHYEDEGKPEFLSWLKGQTEAKFWIENRDKEPGEIYYYNHLDEARYHFELFREDDSELYSRIVLALYKKTWK